METENSENSVLPSIRRVLQEKKGQRKLKNCPGCVSIDLPVTRWTPCSFLLLPSIPIPFRVLSLRSLWNLFHFASCICCNLPWHPPLCVYLLALPLPLTFLLLLLPLPLLLLQHILPFFIFFAFVAGDLRVACQPLLIHLRFVFANHYYLHLRIFIDSLSVLAKEQDI